jgi:hypothetical protein
MQRENWISIFEKIPETLHDQVVFSLSTGIDVYNQRFLQFGLESLLIRGRLGGTDEGSRIFMIPWEELKLVFFSRPLEDDVLVKVYGDIIGGVRKSMATKARQQQEEEAEQEVEEEEEHRPQPVRLPAASFQMPTPDTSEAKQQPDLNELRSRLLNKRKPPPNAPTNKPGTYNKPSK